MSAPGSEDITTKDIVSYKVYKIRWFIVFIYALVNCTNSFIWISFSPVTNRFVEFYKSSEFILNITILIFPISTIILGLFAAFLLNVTGVRFVLLFSSGVNLISSFFRFMSSEPKLNISSNAKIILYIVGQIFASTAQPFCMSCTTTLAFDWFPENQRTIANTIASLGNPFGVLLGNAIVPLVIKHSSDLPIFNSFFFAVTAFEFIIIIVFVRRNKPLSYPSEASYLVKSDQLFSFQNVLTLNSVRDFGRNLMKPFKQFSFWVVLVIFGFAVGYFTTLSSLFQQMLCNKGYGNEFIGLCGSLLIASGLVLSAPIAIIVDKTGKLVEAIKIGFSLSVLGCIGLSAMMWFQDQKTGIIIFVMVLGGFGFGVYSLILELVADATFPLPGIFTSSILIIFSQIISVLMVLMFQLSAPFVKKSNISTCGSVSTPQNYDIPNMVTCGILVLLAIVQLFTITFPNKRHNFVTTIQSDTDIQSSTIYSA